MARENKTRYALLGLLSREPMSGYDVKKAIERGLGLFWSESYGQIYPVLTRIEKEGLATATYQPQERRPDRIIYTITDKGLDELRAWLLKPADPQKERVEVLLKLFFGLQIPVDACITHIERFREEHVALLKKYDSAQNRAKTEQPGHPYLPLWLLAASCGNHVSRAYVAWCDEAVATLKRMAEKEQS